MEEEKTGNPGQTNILNEFAQRYAAAFELVLHGRSNQSVICTCIGLAQTTHANFLPLLSEWSLMFEVTYESAPPGQLAFLLKPKEAQRLCDLSLNAAPPERNELAATEVATLQGIINQAVGITAPQLRPDFDIACSPSSLGNPKELQQPGNAYFTDVAPMLVTLMIEVEAIAFDAQLLMVLSPSLCRALIKSPEPAQQATAPESLAPTSPSPAATPAAAMSQAAAKATAGTAAEKKEKNLSFSDVERNLERILDIELPVSLNFGHTHMLLKDVLQFSPGSIIQLDRTVDEPVCLTINNKVIARGEVVIVDGNYGIRITDIESTVERIRSLR